MKASASSNVVSSEESLFPQLKTLSSRRLYKKFGRQSLLLT
jgi:hypothetical protein